MNLRPTLRRFSDQPIRIKLLGLILLSSGVALFLAMIAIVIFDSYDYTEQKINDLATQAEILGKTSTAALTFNDPKAATEYLAALKAQPTIIAAVLYGADGQLFASYSSEHDRSGIFPKVQASGHRVHGEDIELFHRIEQNNEVIGTVYLRAHLQKISRMLHYAWIVLLVILVSLTVGLWLSTRLQRIISTPILKIATVANAVIDQKDYALRAVKYSQDEIGSLTEAFNQMLSHIQERDANLLTSNQSLQEEVEARKQAQEALKQNIQELARSNAELEQFAYVSSHDLQEPLRMVASYTQLLEKRYFDKFDEKGLLFLHYIVDGAKRMQELIDDLLVLSRVGTRNKPMQIVPSEEAVKIALLNLKPLVQESQAKTTYEVLPMVVGDLIQLTQLFQNLLSNAIKFRGSHIPHIQISATKLNEYWLFAVKDNGIGIAPEHFERIFIIFQRLYGRSEYPGSGIGLAICKKIVERHGGRIWVESKTGEGTTFYFTLREKR